MSLSLIIAINILADISLVPWPHPCSGTLPLREEYLVARSRS